MDLSRTRIDQALKVLDVDGAVQRVKGGWVTTGAPWSYDHKRYDGLADAREQEQDLMLAYEATDACRMVFLRSELDDPTIGEGERCGRCDNCTGNHLPTDVDPALAERIDARLKAPGVPLSQRKMWPTGSARRGKIKGVLGGKALGRLNDVARGPALAQLLRDNTYRPATNWRDDQWLTRFVAVLADWDWGTRPATVVALGSADPARAEMVASTAEALARVGQMTYGGVVRAGETEVQARNSAFRVNALDRYFDYSGLDVGEGPVLLLAGEVDSGWSVTVAAADIAERFGVEVLPLAFASRA